MQAHGMLRADLLEPRQARAAVDDVVFRMHLEPEALRAAVPRLLEMLGLESEAGSERLVHGGVACVDQDLTGLSEPMPFGVLIVVHVPFGTFFHAFPW